MWNWKWIKLYLLVLRTAVPLRSFPLQERVCITSLWPVDPNTLYTGRCVWFIKSLSLYQCDGCSPAAEETLVFTSLISARFWYENLLIPLHYLGTKDVWNHCSAILNDSVSTATINSQNVRLSCQYLCVYLLWNVQTIFFYVPQLRITSVTTDSNKIF